MFPKNKINTIAARLIGRCTFTILLSNFTGLIKLDKPITNKKLHTQLPIAFPIIKSECPSIEDVIVINISGSDVPIATTVKPINISDKLNLLAILAAALTNKSAPFINKINPTTISIISNTKSSPPLFLLYFLPYSYF